MVINILNSHKSLAGSVNFSPFLSDEKTEVQRNDQLLYSPSASQWGSQDLSPGSLTPQPTPVNMPRLKS